MARYRPSPLSYPTAALDSLQRAVIDLINAVRRIEEHLGAAEENTMTTFTSWAAGLPGVIVAQDAEIAEYLWNKLGTQRPGSVCLGVKSEAGAPVAAALVEKYTGPEGACHMHVAAEWRFLKRAYVRALMSYAFDYLRCRVIYAHVSETNAPALRLNKRLGFKEHARLPDFFGPDDTAVVMSLRAEDWAAIAGDF